MSSQEQPPMLLEQLLGDLAPQAFLDEYFLRLPYSCPGGCEAWRASANWETLLRLLATPEADVIVGRGGQHWPGERPRTEEEARQVLASGYMIGVRHAERHDGRLLELAQAFDEAFRAPVDIHLYCSPAGQPGFGWHYDAEEVFILQTQGAKEWWLRKNTVHPWPLIETLPEDMRYEREIMPVMRCSLSAGDWLYIPAGYWHKTESVAESISLSVGVAAHAAIAALDLARRKLLSSILWRQRLPVVGSLQTASREELLERYQQVFAELGRDLTKLFASPRFASEFIESLERSDSTGEA